MYYLKKKGRGGVRFKKTKERKERNTILEIKLYVKRKYNQYCTGLRMCLAILTYILLYIRIFN